MNITKCSRILALIGILTIAPASSAWCEDSNKLADVLKKALTASADGKCPPSLMSAMLVGACEQQMPQLGNKLKARGSITSLDFKGIQQTAAAPAEVYRVKFSGGSSMMWMINVGSDDKIVVLWSNE